MTEIRTPNSRNNNMSDNEALPDAGMSSIVKDMPVQDTATQHMDKSNQFENDKLDGYLRDIAARNKESFEKLYDQTINRMYSLALRITQKHEISEEVISDLYFQIWQQANRYQKSRGGVVTWLSMICRSRSLDALRRAKLHSRESVNIEAIAEEADTTHPQELLLAVERESQLHQSILQLTEQQRQLLSLAYYRGYTHTELAEFTGTPLGTVKTQLRRAVIALKEIMINKTDITGVCYE